MNLRKLFILSALILTSCSGLNAGWRAQKSGDYAEAQRQAIIALSKEPKNPEVYQLIATTQLSQGQFDSALKSAQFASSLDGGSEESERLIRDICTAKKTWSCICESGLKEANAGRQSSEDELARYRESYGALSGHAESYGCLKILEASGEKPDNADAVRAAYASFLAANGHFKEAIAIEEECADPSISQLRAAEHLYLQKKAPEAKVLLQRYVDGGSDIARESRAVEAAAVSSAHLDWINAAEILGALNSKNVDIPLGIALRHAFRPDEAEAIFESHFAEERPAHIALAETEQLLSAGYAHTAMTAFETSSDAINSDETVLTAAELFYQAGRMNMASQLLTRLSDRHVKDLDLQKQYFEWSRDRKLSKAALTAGERARKLGESDPDFIEAMLGLYLDNREVMAFEREAEAWISREKAPAVRSRSAVARLEAKRHNWAGTVETLKPLDKSGMPENVQALYFRALKNTHEYAELFKALDRYMPEMSPYSKAEYFESPDAEKEYIASLEPLFHTNDKDKAEAEMTIARYQYDIKGDEQAGADAVERALTAFGKNSDGYETVIRFIKSRDVLKAAEYAKQWRELDTQAEKPCEILGQLYLQSKQIPEAEEAYHCMVLRSSDPKRALHLAYQDFNRNRETASGLIWLENHPIKETAPIAHLEILSQSLEQATRAHAGNDDQNKLWRVKAIAGFNKLVEQNPKSAQNYAMSLAALDAYSDAIKAYEVADKQNAKYSANQQIERVRTMIRGRGDGDKIQKIVNQMSTEADAFNMINMLESEQALVYGEDLLEQLLEAKSANARTRAFTYLIRQARFSGNTKKINEYARTLEKSAPENADIRIKLAEFCISTHDFDNANRHLTYLHGVRPDSREVLNLELNFVRQAPNHTGAQKLEQSLIESAEGVYHRLDWISQYYEQTGDHERALIFAEKAYASTPAVQDSLKLRILKLYIRTGKLDSDEFASHYQDYKNSSSWNVENIRALAKEAQNAAYYRESLEWISEAMALAPQNVGLKRLKLEMALEAEQEDQIALSLEKAIEPPVAEVMDPLRDSGSIQDAITAIDMFETNGEYEMALPSLISILPYYIEFRGISAAHRALTTWGDLVPGWNAEVARILTKSQLMGDEPCKAIAYTTDLEDTGAWAQLLSRCPDAQASIMDSLHSTMAEMSTARRMEFEREIYHNLMNHRAVSAARQFADKTGISTDNYDVFEQTFHARGALEALMTEAHNTVAPDRMLDVFETLAAYGYLNEAASYARTELSHFPDETQSTVALEAMMLGKEAPEFDRAIAKASYTDFERIRGYHLASEAQISKWLSRTPTSQLTPLIEFTLKAASLQPAAKKEILETLQKEMGQRNARTSVHIAFIMLATELGFDQEALNTANQLQQNMPDSEFIYQMKSLAEAHLGKTSDAVKTLEEGARQAANPALFWSQVHKLHANSNIEIREAIHNAEIDIAPRNPQFLIDAVDIALAKNDLNNAKELAESAYHSGSASILRQIADIYDAHGKLAEFPESLLQGNGTTHHLIKGQVLLKHGNEDDAAQEFQEAARTAPWPPVIYTRIIEIWLAHKNMQRAEQAIALYMQRFPYAASPLVYRATYELSHESFDNAWNDYIEARARSIDTDPWMPRLIQAAAQYNQIDFAKKLFDYEQTHGTLNESLWIKSVLDTLHNDVQKYPEREQQLNAQYLEFIHTVLSPKTSLSPEALEIQAKFQTR